MFSLHREMKVLLVLMDCLEKREVLESPVTLDTKVPLDHLGHQ